MSNPTKTSVNQKTQRTRIEAISLVGYELSDEQLRLVAGGARSAGTCSPDASCDDD